MEFGEKVKLIFATTKYSKKNHYILIKVSVK